MVLRLVLALAVFACSSKATTPTTPTPPGGVAATGTLAGSVSFVGTPCPEPKGPPCDGPYPSYEVVVYAEDGATVVTKTTTGVDGTFSVELPEGKYVLWTQAGADRMRADVTVSRDALENVELRVDSGVR